VVKTQILFMPLAVTHVLVPIISLALFKDYSRRAEKYFTKKHVFLVGVAGLSPDIDLILYRIAQLLGQSVPPSDIGHRIIFHNIWIPLGFIGFYFLFNYFAKSKKSKRYQSFSKIFLVLFIGFTMHLLLDAVLTGHVMPFYPLDSFMINLDLVGQAAAVSGIPGLTILVSMDALLLLFWLWHQEMEHHISDYF